LYDISVVRDFSHEVVIGEDPKARTSVLNNKALFKQPHIVYGGNEPKIKFGRFPRNNIKGIVFGKPVAKPAAQGRFFDFYGKGGRLGR
jgi:hypothetical protein